MDALIALTLSTSTEKTNSHSQFVRGCYEKLIQVFNDHGKNIGSSYQNNMSEPLKHLVST